MILLILLGAALGGYAYYFQPTYLVRVYKWWAGGTFHAAFSLQALFGKVYLRDKLLYWQQAYPDFHKFEPCNSWETAKEWRRRMKDELKEAGKKPRVPDSHLTTPYAPFARYLTMKNDVSAQAQLEIMKKEIEECQERQRKAEQQ